jgi:transcriptional regulator with PAS, ATPase and Fis domain
MLGSVTIICNNKQSKVAWKKRIFDLLGNRLTIKAYTYDQLTKGEDYYDDLIVIVPQSLDQHVIPCIDPKAKYIFGHRTLNVENIYKLIDIPIKSRVIILNDKYEFSLEIINELKSLGFADYDYYPYDQNKSPQEEYEYAVTCGEGHLMPEISHIIDLGQRQVSISTIGEILRHFTGSVDIDQYLFNRYISYQIRTSIQLYRETQKNYALRKQMEAIVSEFDEGVILFDNNYDILICNSKSKDILKDRMNGQYLRENIPKSWNFKEQIDFFIEDKSRPLHVSLKTFSFNSNQICMATISDISKVQDIEERYKRQQKTEGLTANYSFKDIFFKSESMASVVTTAHKYSSSDANVLIIGESGTGKELFAQAIHNASQRRNGPFIAINCGALSSGLLESELFGYEEGAFTGAVKGGKRGLFEIAHKGTLFLDEIADAPFSVQQKLLRALQEKEIIRVSGTKPIYVDVRIISATNKNLTDEVDKGNFRRDLFYRINVMTLRIPPLRERGPDIIPLFYYLLNKKLIKIGIPVLEPKREDNLQTLLLNHTWPGNIREIVNLVEVISNSLAIDPQIEISKEIQNYWNMIYHSDNKISAPTTTKIPTDILSLKTHIHEKTKIVFEILSKLESDGKAPGRSAVYRYCVENDMPFTEQQIQLRIDRLRELGLIRKTKGYGNLITELGREYLESEVDINRNNAKDKRKESNSNQKNID